MLKNSRTSTTTKLILLLMKFCQCKKFFVFVKKFLSMFKNSLFREIIFLELPKYSWNLKILSIIEKLKDWKILLKIVKKLAHIFPCEVEKLARLLARSFAKLKKLARLCHICTLNWKIGTLNWKIGSFGTFITLINLIILFF